MDWQKDRQTYRKTNRWADSQNDSQEEMDGQKERLPDRYIHIIQTDVQVATTMMFRKSDRWTDRQTDTDWQIDREGLIATTKKKLIKKGR